MNKEWLLKQLTDGTFTIGIPVPTFGDGMRRECRFLETVMELIDSCRSAGACNASDFADTLQTAHFTLAGVKGRLNWYLKRQAPGALISVDELINLEDVATIEPSDQLTQELKDAFEIQKKQIAKAMSIIEACRLGSRSTLPPFRHEEGDEGDEGECHPNFDGALTVAYDLLEVVKITLRNIVQNHPDGQKQTVFIL